MEIILVEDCCEILDSKRIPITAKDRIPGPYPYYGANGIQDYVDNYIFDDELVLLAEDGGNFGSTEKPIAYRVSGKCWVNNHAHVLKPKQGIDVDYLCYSLMFYDTSGLVNGATRQKLTQSTLKKMCIPKRTVKQQLQIVQELNIIKKLITARNQELQRLDDLIKARFVEMFGDPVHSAIDSKIELSDICEKITDGEHGSVARVANGHPFLNAKHILKTGFIDWETITYIGDEDHQRIYKRCNPEKGDILLTTTGTIGNVAIMPECEEVSMDRGITLLKINRHKVTSEFVAEMLKHPSVQIVMGANVHASAIGHLYMNKVKKLPATLPSMKKQIEFTTFVHQIDKSKLLSGCRLFHSWAPENRDKPKHVGAPRRRTKDLRGIRRQHTHLHH